ncbi:MAG: NifU family protein, partial [Planctomycetales bacterium]|nr:NifU family protein [Planctomycetales bacterium]
MATSRSVASESRGDANVELERLARRVDRAVEDVQSLEPEVRDRALELKSAIEAFHKAGLTYLIRAMKNDARARDVLFELVEEPSVYALFAMHGLVRDDLRTRVARTIELVRPYMLSHGGDIALVDVRGDAAIVRLDGACDGCSMAAQTLRNTVEETLRERVPEIDRVEVISDAPLPLVHLEFEKPRATAGPDDSASSNEMFPAATEHGWIEGPSINEFVGEMLYAFEATGVSVLLVRTRAGLRAFRNACAHQGLSLEGALFDAESDVVTCPWHGFKF